MLYTKVVTLISLLFLQWVPKVCYVYLDSEAGAGRHALGEVRHHAAALCNQHTLDIQISGQPAHLGTAAARRLQAGPRTAPRCSTAPPPCSPRCSAAASPRRAAAASPPSPPPCTSCWCCYYLDLLTINQRSCTITEKATTVFTFKTLLKHYAKWALTPW